MSNVNNHFKDTMRMMSSAKCKKSDATFHFFLQHCHELPISSTATLPRMKYERATRSTPAISTGHVSPPP